MCLTIVTRKPQNLFKIQVLLRTLKYIFFEKFPVQINFLAEILKCLHCSHYVNQNSNDSGKLHLDDKDHQRVIWTINYWQIVVVYKTVIHSSFLFDLAFSLLSNTSTSFSRRPLGEHLLCLSGNLTLFGGKPLSKLWQKGVFVPSVKKNGFNYIIYIF